ncbi:hypothetical protein C0995_015692 [Termitomyces sp. Mi166|nr:hypothetical protein C0995_015692 [Termitomyces sp. Mi166\
MAATATLRAFILSTLLYSSPSSSGTALSYIPTTSEAVQVMHLVYRPTSPNVSVNSILSEQARTLSPTSAMAHTPTTASVATSSTAASSLSVNGLQDIAPWAEPILSVRIAVQDVLLDVQHIPLGVLVDTATTSTLSTSESQSQSQSRLSADDGSTRDRSGSNSSTVLESPSLRKSKSSFLSKFRSRSKSRPRANSNDVEHPSLQKPPPIPDGKIFIPPPLTSPENNKKDKGKDKAQKKKKSSDVRPLSLPPKPEPEDVLREIDLTQWGLEDLLNEGIIGASGQPAPRLDTSREASSPSSEFDSGIYPSISLFDEFSDPFVSSHPTSLAAKRKGGIYRSSRISPKDRLLDKVLPASPTTEPSWTAPESWGVGNHDLDAEYESSVDEDYGTEDPATKAAGTERPMSFAVPDPHDLESSYPSAVMIPPPPLPPKREKKDKGRRRVTPYTVRIYKDDDSFHEARMPLATTVAELVPQLNEKLFIPKHETYRLYVRERGRERLLGMTEKPANLIKRRLEHHGYDANDGIILLRGDRLSFLIRFIYRSSLFTPDKQVTINSFENVDLEGCALVAIPIAVHKNAEKVVSLKLSGNPMLEIPLDFVQSCTSLRDLRLSNMSMKTVPKSVRHVATLRKLDLSSNRIGNLEDASLDRNSSLEYLYLQNNRLENLPWYFPRLHSLTVLNISNNKFRTVPYVVCQLESLADLDISFNMISELPEEFGKLTQLKSLTIVGNHISQFPDECSQLVHLRKLDCRRNAITNLCVMSMLPQLQNLFADHNAVHGLYLSLGPCLKTLIASHNEITQLSLVPGPVGRPYALTTLDISHAKLSSLDRFALGHLSSLKHLRLDHNSFQSIPETLGDLKDLETFSCSDNKLNELPRTIGKLQRLTDLDAHNNSLTQLPLELWNCAKLEKINVTSNFLGIWHDPPFVDPSSSSCDSIFEGLTSTLAPHEEVQRKASTSSLTTNSSNYPPLVHSLKRLYLGENRLTDDALHPIMHLRELRVLNLSFNELQDLPTRFFRGLTQLEELYLSGNKIASIPTEDLHRLERLKTLYLNGNRLYTLPQELQMLRALTSLDVGSNQLKYNTNNFEFDWNWNFNKTLKYLNLSGNKRLQIKIEKRQTYYGHGPPKHPNAPSSNLSSFTDLTQLRVLGLMDVTLPTVRNGTADTPEEMDDRRVRTSASTILKMSYGIADALGKNDTLNMLDLVQEIKPKTQNVGAVFAMFGRSQPPRPGYPGVHANRLAKYLRDRFVGNFVYALDNMEKYGDAVPDALRRSFLEMNRCLIQALKKPPKDPRKNSIATIDRDFRFSPPVDQATKESGAAGIVVYFQEKENARTMYVANAGDSLAVVSSQGVAELVAHRHDPFDRSETARIRTAEGWVSPSGFVNGMVDVSRSFGFYQYMPAVNARPDVFTYHLTSKDEFVIIADRSLWDFVSFQTAVDIARTERGDPMIAAQKLRDFAISYGAEGSTMIMVIGLAEAPEMEGPKKKPQILDRQLARLEGEVPAPVGHIALVFSDIRNSTHLWEVNPGMATAHKAHNALLRRLLRFCGGYEVKTEGDAFMCAFPTSLAAVWWSLRVQSELIEVAWPLEILECEDGQPIYDTSGNLIARGLSVRMGIHCGFPSPEPDPITHRMDYFGTMVNRSARICGNAAGGEIMCSAEILREIKASVYGETETEYTRSQPTQAVDEIRQMGLHIVDVGEVKLKGLEVPENISLLYPSHLAGRQNWVPEGITESGSRVPFSVEQMRELGLICLRLETLTTSRIFNTMPERKGSIQTLSLENEISERSSSLKLFGDPNVLLPPMNAQSTDSELMALLDSLATRVVNAISALLSQAQLQTQPLQSPPSSNKDRVISALEKRGELDERTLEHILSVLNTI